MSGGDVINLVFYLVAGLAASAIVGYAWYRLFMPDANRQYIRTYVRRLVHKP